VTEFPEYDSLPADRRILFDAMYEEAHAGLVRSLKADNDVVVSSARRIAAWNFRQREKAEGEKMRLKASPAWDVSGLLKVACEE